MFEKIIEYFSRRHLLTNFIMLGVFIGGIYFWHATNKEEMPDVSFDRIRISASYPGASPEEVEYFVTRPLEEELRGLDGIYSIKSTSSAGNCGITVELEPDNPDRDEVITDIKNTVMEVKLPDEVTDDPRVREFKTSKKAIIDIVVIDTNIHLLNDKTRKELQKYALALENQLLNLPEVNSINRSGYLKEELQIKAIPWKLMQYNIPFNTVMKEIRNNNIRQPAGSIENKDEAKVTLTAELDNEDKLNELIVQGGFEGQAIRLKDIATVNFGFEKNTSIMKVNGHEAIILNVVKNSSAGILKAVDTVIKKVEEFKSNSLKGSSVKIVILDDGSQDVRNRLSLIGMNGAIGFILILTMLFLFLNFRAGVWVAMGIPFTFCFAMIIASMAGYTINNITLAAVIIVMGMVVDDAIVVSENISRMHAKGMPMKEAVVKGTSYVFLPIVASITTTCVAFIPLFAFTGRMAMMIKFIPPIIFFMLGGSLFESIFILPAHMNLHMPRFLTVLVSYIKQLFLNRPNKKRPTASYRSQEQQHWFHAVEDKYGRLLEKILKHKIIIFSTFGVLLVLAGFIFVKEMKFVLFPNEETTQFHLSAMAAPETKKYKTAVLARQLEDIFYPYIGKEVVGYRTFIARSRRGGAVEENSISMQIEIVPKDQRKRTLNQLITEWQKKFKEVKDLQEIKIIKSHFGQESGSPIEIKIQENNEQVRMKVVNKLLGIMEKDKLLKNVEIERSLRNPEYKIGLNRDKIKRLGINPVNIASTLRSLLEGSILYELKGEEEEIDVRFTSLEASKNNLRKVLNVPVENQGNYLVPLIDIVNIEEVVSPNSITREDLKRTTSVYSGLNEKAGLTPVEIAEKYEKDVFPKIMTEHPTTVLYFAGEVQDTRESKGEFMAAIIMVIFLIYIILALLFNSLYKPLLIMLSIPFGVVGIILAFYLHGITVFGFFAGIGALGLAGVVVNDSIVMLVKLDKEHREIGKKIISIKQISDIAKTRLRAVLLTTLTTVAGLLPTAYGFAGYDSMLAEMMLALAWGLMFGTFITLILIPSLYSLMMDIIKKFKFVSKILPAEGD
ncbi:MAG: efflux RND transporter permease subunit [Spirochaetes bacterium]|nr:efflux RND transporter permease subunit [Spirochaetota bacterium]